MLAQELRPDDAARAAFAQHTKRAMNDAPERDEACLLEMYYKL